MRHASKLCIAALSVLTALPVLPMAAGAAPPAPEREGPETEYVVVLDEADAARGRSAISAAGGTVVRENAKVGVVTVKSTKVDFAGKVNAQPGVASAARNNPVAKVPKARVPGPSDLEKGEGELKPGQTAPGGPAVRRAPQAGQPTQEPLGPLQWDMRAMGASPEGSYAINRGHKGVRVGVIDTGIDATHPDIRPNFDFSMSRNFTTDMPDIDGACAEDPDGSCEDPATVDEGGHGTHVASTIGSPINGIGMAGVAPDVTLVNLRAGQDSGYFFLPAVVDALIYAGDNGIDVVNMSFFVDPWLFNCWSNPADSVEARAQQRTTLLATQRALNYARLRGVTLISAAGNEHTDLSKPSVDASSPDYPSDSAYKRNITPGTCLSMPSQGHGVITVSSTGKSGRKASYSNWGFGQIDVSAPGGDASDMHGTPEYRSPTNLTLAAYPEGVLRAEKLLDAAGNPTTTAVVKDCTGGTCSYYRYLQGTSMASPHVAGVASLIVARWGHPDWRHGGVKLSPFFTEWLLYRTAVPSACPTPRVYDYPDLNDTYTATCEGSTGYNGFYGRGVANALNAVGNRRGDRAGAADDQTT